MPGWRSTERASAGQRIARLSIEPAGGGTALVFSGRLNAAGAGGIWSAAIRAATAARGQALRFDLSGVEAFDMAGAALLLAAERAHGMPIELAGANPHATDLLARARRAVGASAPRGQTPQGQTGGEAQGETPRQVPVPGRGQAAREVPREAPREAPEKAPIRTPWRGQWRTEWPTILPVTAATLEALANGVAFIGEAAVAAVRLPARRRHAAGSPTCCATPTRRACARCRWCCCSGS